MTSHHVGHGDGHGPELSHYARRARAIEALLVEKGLCTVDEVQRTADRIDARSPADGARVVARAWVDSEFKGRLLANATAAVAELGYTLAEPTPRLVAAENTDKVHHLVVCTLCSCYPRALLGRPPDWYKSLAYRSRAVVDPRGVLQEFGLALSADAVVHVLDSTADLRYLVVPRRPAGTEHLREEELASLVTRDSMIGVSHARSPEPAVAG
jgi:nitrile hydratase